MKIGTPDLCSNFMANSKLLRLVVTAGSNEGSYIKLHEGGPWIMMWIYTEHSPDSPEIKTEVKRLAKWLGLGASDCTWQEE